MGVSQVVEFAIESLPQLAGTFVGGMLSLIGVMATNRHARKLAKVSGDAIAVDVIGDKILLYAGDNK